MESRNGAGRISVIYGPPKVYDTATVVDTPQSAYHVMISDIVSPVIVNNVYKRNASTSFPISLWAPRSFTNKRQSNVEDP